MYARVSWSVTAARTAQTATSQPAHANKAFLQILPQGAYSLGKPGFIWLQLSILIFILS